MAPIESNYHSICFLEQIYFPTIQREITPNDITEFYIWLAFYETYLNNTSRLYADSVRLDNNLREIDKW